MFGWGGFCFSKRWLVVGFDVGLVVIPENVTRYYCSLSNYCPRAFCYSLARARPFSGLHTSEHETVGGASLFILSHQPD
jgi:hypothetical protein